MSRRAAQDQAKIIRGVIERFPVDAPGAPATRTAAVRDALLEVADRIEGNRGGGGDADRREPADKLIARRLEISEQTVKAHATSAFRRIGVDDRTQAAQWARRNGLVGDGHEHAAAASGVAVADVSGGRSWCSGRPRVARMTGLGRRRRYRLVAGRRPTMAR